MNFEFIRRRLVVGVLAQLVAHAVDVRAFQMETLLIRLALVVLTVLMFSTRLQRNLQTFVEEASWPVQLSRVRTWHKQTNLV